MGLCDGQPTKNKREETQRVLYNLSPLLLPPLPPFAQDNNNMSPHFLSFFLFQRKPISFSSRDYF